MYLMRYYGDQFHFCAVGVVTTFLYFALTLLEKYPELGGRRERRKNDEDVEEDDDIFDELKSKNSNWNHLNYTGQNKSGRHEDPA